MSYNPKNPNGQATSSNSSPVVIASDQSAVDSNLAKVGGNTVATAATGIAKVGLTDGSGNALNSTSNALNVNVQNATGSATGSAVPANAVYQGGDAATALPTAATAGNLVGAMYDKFGRQVVISQTVRDLVGQQSTTITSSTSATTVVSAGGSGVLTDISSIVLVNSSATATQATLSDGTNSYFFYVPAGDTRGASYNVPLPATTANTAWTVTCGTSVASLLVTVVYIKNK